MLTFLKKLGTMIVNIAGIATGLGPLIQPFLGSGKAGKVTETAVNDLTQIAQLVVVIESAFGAVSGTTGAQKLQALVPLVANVIKTSEVVSGKTIANNDLFIKGSTEVAQGIVDVLNSINADDAKHS